MLRITMTAQPFPNIKVTVSIHSMETYIHTNIHSSDLYSISELKVMTWINGKAMIFRFVVFATTN